MFQDDFHLRTLRIFLEACKKLNPRVSIKAIIISMIDRLAAFAAREAEEEDEDGEDEEEDEDEDVDEDENQADDEDGEPAKGRKARSKQQTERDVARGIPKDVPLFDIFWDEVTEVIKVY